MQVEYDDENMCMMRGCTQVDLLPGKCGKCNRKFCHAHLPYEAHRCVAHRDAVVLSCPICGKTIPCGPKEDPNIVVSQHIDRGCKDPAGLRSSNDARNHESRLNFCSFPQCHKNELALILCDKCGNSYCVDHRMPVRHHCREGASTAERVSPQVPRLSPPPRNAAFSAPCNTKKTPLGSYNGDNPITLLVCFAVEQRTAPFYFKTSEKTVVGRLLDQACEAAHVPNNNNNAADSGDRWRVFVLSSEDGHRQPELLPFNKELGSFLSNGDTVFMVKSDTLPDYVTQALSTAKKHSHQHGCSLM